MAYFFLVMSIALFITACSPEIPPPIMDITLTPTGLVPTATPDLLTQTPRLVIETATPIWTRNEILYNEINLAWVECQFPRQEFYYDDWAMAKKCVDVKSPTQQATDKKRFGESFYRPHTNLPEDLRLVIGKDVYETKHQGQYFELMKNGKTVAAASGQSLGYHNRALLNVNGEVAWEFADFRRPRIIYRGINLLDKYGLEAAYIPNVINDKLIFAAKKKDHYVVMYDGQQLGPDFGYITVGYCCESVTYSISRPVNQYWFWGSRDGEHYVVAIIGK